MYSYYVWNMDCSYKHRQVYFEIVLAETFYQKRIARVHIRLVELNFEHTL